MKLYFSPGACSLSPHIVANEAGIPLDLVKVDMRTKTVDREGDFWNVNPKGYVPALELDDGEVLTEGPAIVQFLADRAPATGLAPANGSFARVRLQEALNYLTSEIHKAYSPLFNPDVLPAVREERLAYLTRRYALIEKQLEGRKYLLGDRFTVADAYLFTLTRWARAVKLDLSGFPNLEAFQKRVGSRKAVLEAMRVEGLIPDSKAA
ncbi:MAG TPA: glutathione transferase GstA [Steroidobacteraceae bacterium]|nr:glutathione transferase GstA [Steroidobacteraceae bacterium]